MEAKTVTIKVTSPQPDGVWELFAQHDYMIAIKTPDGSSLTRAVTPVLSSKR